MRTGPLLAGGDGLPSPCRPLIGVACTGDCPVTCWRRGAALHRPTSAWSCVHGGLPCYLLAARGCAPPVNVSLELRARGTALLLAGADGRRPAAQRLLVAACT